MRKTTEQQEKGPSVPRGSPAAQAALGSAFRASVSRRPSLGGSSPLGKLSCSSSRVRRERCTQCQAVGTSERCEAGVIGGLGGAEDPRLPDRPPISPWDLPFPLGPDPTLYTTPWA